MTGRCRPSSATYSGRRPKPGGWLEQGEALAISTRSATPTNDCDPDAGCDLIGAGRPDRPGSERVSSRAILCARGLPHLPPERPHLLEPGGHVAHDGCDPDERTRGVH